MIFPTFSLHALALLTILTSSSCTAQALNSTSSALTPSELSSTTRRLLEVFHGTTATGKFGPDAIKIGNYTLLGCSSTTSANPNTDQLTTFLPTFLSRLKFVLRDANKGMSSLHGYGNFFRTEENKDAVRETYSKIQQGVKLFLRSRKGVKVETPKIICLGDAEGEGHSTAMHNLFELFCSGTFPQHAAVTQFRRTEIVLLCPSFFKLDPLPTNAWCPENGNGNPRPYADRLIQTQYGSLMRVLAGLYIPATRLSPKLDTVPSSFYDVADLDGNVALVTRDSYAYYASCKLILC